MSNAIRTTIDASGRLVIPKSLRDALTLTAGTEVEITLLDGCLEITPAADDLMWLGREGIPFPVLPEGAGLDVDEVRTIIEGVRR